MNDELLQKYQLKNERYRIELESISGKLNQHTRLIDECLSVRGSIDEFRAFMKEQKETMNSLRADLANVCAARDEVSKKLEALEKTCSSHQKDHEALKKSACQLMQNFSELSEKVNGLSFDRQLASLKKDNENAISEMKKLVEKTRADLVVSPADIISNNKDLLQKLEVAQIDGSNAVLKISNLELGMRILEKKMETLHILLKKIDLTHQPT